VAQNFHATGFLVSTYSIRSVKDTNVRV